MVRGGRKIEAIKTLRAASSYGLKEAKDAVEEYEATGDSAPIRKFFSGFCTTPSAQLAFEHGTVVVMPEAREVKIEGVFNQEEWERLRKIIAAIDPRWS